MSTRVTKLRLMHRFESVTEELEEVKQALEEARRLGDLSENTEYETALQNFTKLLQEKANLEYQLENLKETDTYSKNISKGTLISVMIEHSDGKLEDLGLMMFDDKGSSLFDGTISDASPLGRAIRGGLSGKYPVQNIKGEEITYIVKVEPESRLEEYLAKYPPDRKEKIDEIFGDI